jgi:hypothetical protein
MNDLRTRGKSTPPSPENAPANGSAPAAPLAASPSPAGRQQEWTRWLGPIASLRLTVVLFVLALLLVFYGTLVQVDLPNYTTIRLYFRSFIVWIPARVLLFNMPHETIQSWGLENFALPFPGGWLIGGVMLVNLLAAHAIHFKMTWRRSGILMIHAGLVLMMLSEVITGVYALEGNMYIFTGSSSNYLQHSHLPEIAITHPSAKKGTDVVAVVPTQYLATGATIEDPQLPCKLKILQYMTNSSVIEILDPQWKNPATMGLGLDSQAIERPEVTGTDTMQEVDAPSAYVQLTDRGSGKDLGTLLLSVHAVRPQSVTIGDRSYDISLRFKRSYRDYNLFLKKFVHANYIGTEKPKDFRAFVRFTDPAKKVERDIEIYMNHPFRYEGETFYQSGTMKGNAGTVLQVVRNPGWTLPYLSCIIVGVGMMVHFGMMLNKFVSARAKT